jgi:hypothetical protein
MEVHNPFRVELMRCLHQGYDRAAHLRSVQPLALDLRSQRLVNAGISPARSQQQQHHNERPDKSTGAAPSVRLRWVWRLDSTGTVDCEFRSPVDAVERGAGSA